MYIDKGFDVYYNNWKGTEDIETVQKHKYYNALYIALKKVEIKDISNEQKNKKAMELFEKFKKLKFNVIDNDNKMLSFKNIS